MVTAAAYTQNGMGLNYSGLPDIGEENHLQ